MVNKHSSQLTGRLIRNNLAAQYKKLPFNSFKKQNKTHTSYSRVVLVAVCVWFPGGDAESLPAVSRARPGSVPEGCGMVQDEDWGGVHTDAMCLYVTAAGSGYNWMREPLAAASQLQQHQRLPAVCVCVCRSSVSIPINSVCAPVCPV